MNTRALAGKASRLGEICRSCLLPPAPTLGVLA